MTSLTLHPAIDTDGWVKTPIKVVDYLVSHFFLSDYSQTAHFPGKVASYAWIVQRYQGNFLAMQQELQSALSAHFEKQFTEVEVEISEGTVKDSINKKAINLFVSFKDYAGETHNLARIIETTTDMKVNNIITVNNVG